MSPNRHRNALTVGVGFPGDRWAIWGLLGWVCFGAAISSSHAQTFGAGTEQGIVDSGAIVEASGIVASRQNPGVLWTHNDSGTPGTVFAIATNGSFLGGYHIASAAFGDYEDIAIGPGPSPEVQYIYLGDIGDNNSTRANIHVYRFPEPAVSFTQTNNPIYLDVAGVEKVELVYPDGPHNCEAMMVDPVTADLFLATKGTNSAGIYRLPRAQFVSGMTVELEFIREIPNRSISGGDISSDGSLVILRRSGHADLWRRKLNQSIGDALAGTPTSVAVIGQPKEPNGEAIGFHSTGLGYYTLSEGFRQPIYFFPRTDAGVPRQPLIWTGPESEWKYEESGKDLGTRWRESDFNDAFWEIGLAPFGYGQGDEATTVFFGPDDLHKNVTTYFRQKFTVTSTNKLGPLAIRVAYNDGLAVYLNGQEILRRDLAPQAKSTHLALQDSSESQNVWRSFPLPFGIFRVGTNVLAAEVHRFDPAGLTLSFGLQLLEARIDPPLQFAQPVRVGTNPVATLNILGPVGFQVDVSTTTNLLDWRNLTRVTLTNGLNRILETNRARGPVQFYRIQ